MSSQSFANYSRNQTSLKVTPNRNKVALAPANTGPRSCSSTWSSRSDLPDLKLGVWIDVTRSVIALSTFTNRYFKDWRTTRKKLAHKKTLLVNQES